MKIMVTGATGFVGKRLIRALQEGGHSIVVLTRNAPRAASILGKGCSYYNWEPGEESVPKEAFTGVDAVINLMGENISTRWSEAKKEDIFKSRVTGTRNLIESINKYKSSTAADVKTILSTSAIGVYGNRPAEEEVTEETEVIPVDFLSDLCIKWEQAASDDAPSDIRLCLLRVGVVIGKEGGALKKMLPPFKVGGGGIIGSGKQMMSWIHVEDLVKLFIHCLNNPNVQGIVNATAPRPVSNKAFTFTLGKVIKRPTVVPMPTFVAKAAFGEMSVILLEGQNVIPKKALNSSFEFKYDSIEKALGEAAK